ncbi:MAG TPA: ribosome biogenesis GTP-binding protein YsxC [Desulfobacterales bacterium]|nr:ribosome biogenesis GTP-binding protein YsxC [Desulfobacterales bacterium]
MNIKSAEFVTSAVKPSQYPPAGRPEIAFAGRSNVGKSSLINALLSRKNLVKTGSKPGRTQTINFFLINESFYFVDLPGYGYAKVPMAVRKRWGPMVEKYLKTRWAREQLLPEQSPSAAMFEPQKRPLTPQLVGGKRRSRFDGAAGLCAVVVILDIRRLPNEGDHDLLGWLSHYEIPALLVLTKADKFKRNKQDKQRNAIARELSIDPSLLSLFSATTGLGKQQLWKTLEGLL